MTEARFEPATGLGGSLRPPPDKSISHRAALIAAMAEGETLITNYLDAGDTRSTLLAVEQLGADVTRDQREGVVELTVQGVGLRGPASRMDPIDVGNAGTLMRLLPGWLAGCEGGSWLLDGDASIRRRPMDRVIEPLMRMGAKIESEPGGHAPLRIEGRPLTGIAYELPVASAQVKSCLLLAGLNAEGPTSVIEPQPTRDHTERMLMAARAPIDVSQRDDGLAVTVSPAESLTLPAIEVPGDFSSAAFFLTAALLVPGSEVHVEGVGLNPTRTGLLGLLRRMGADIEPEIGDATGGEPTGSVVARSSRIRGIEVDPGDVALAIDELPLVALLGCFAEGETVVAGAAELRHKESDRVASVVDGLQGLGARIEALEDGFAVTGTGGLRGGAIDSRGDHRLAMLGAVAGLASREGVTVRGMEAAAVSYPGFQRDLRSLLS